MTAHALGLLLFALAVIIVAARALGALARRIGQPPVIGEILAGVLIGPTFFGTTLIDRLFPVSEVRPALGGLANVGLVLFMFIVGYELDHTLVRGRGKVALSVSIGSILLPFGLGVTLALWLAGHHGVHRVLPFALFIGAAMSVTAFPVLARILTDRGMHRTEIGALALASAAVDDVVAWSLLAVVVIIGSSGGDQWHLLFSVPFLLLMFFGVRPLLRRLAAARDRADRLTPNILAAILVGLFLSCYATEWLGLHAIFGAFLFGAIMPRVGGERLRHEILEQLEQVSVLVLLPAFFVLSGMRVDLSKVDATALVELVLILVVAIVGKFAGAFLGARLHRVPSRQAGALATLMNTRGLTEIVILTVGLQLKILDNGLFSMMVVMALVTTAMAGPLLALIYPRRWVEREVAEAQKVATGVTDAYRVLVFVPASGHEESIVDLAVDLVGGHRPAEVVLSRMLPYRTQELAASTGLSQELLEMTTAMEELAQLARSARASGVETSVLARFSTDAARDLAAQVVVVDPDAVVIAQDHPGYAAVTQAAPGRVVTVAAALPAPGRAVLLRAAGNEHSEAALRIAAQVAAARSVELVVDTGGRVSPRIVGALRELNVHGIVARAAREDNPAPQSPLVVAPVGGVTEGAHLVVRSEPDLAPPTSDAWMDALLAPSASQSSSHPPSGHAPVKQVFTNTGSAAGE